MDSVNSFNYLLDHTSQVLHRQSDQVLQERLGIGMSQFKILLLLGDDVRLSQRTIAHRLGQTEASISRQIKMLLQKGMLAVTVNPKNRREHLIAQTPKGARLTIAAQETLSDYHQVGFSQFSEKQQEQFAIMLQTLHAHYCPESAETHLNQGI